MSDLSRAYEIYAEEAQRMARLERDPNATPRLRRLQAHAVRRAWWTFLEAGKPRREVVAVEIGTGPSRRRVEYVEHQPRRTLWARLTATPLRRAFVALCAFAAGGGITLGAGAIFHG